MSDEQELQQEVLEGDIIGPRPHPTSYSIGIAPTTNESEPLLQFELVTYAGITCVFFPPDFFAEMGIDIAQAALKAGANPTAVLEHAKNLMSAAESAGGVGIVIAGPGDMPKNGHKP